MAQDQSVYTAFDNAMMRARLYCVLMASAAVTGGLVIGSHALFASTAVALLVAWQIGCIAIGIVVASAVMGVTFLLMRPGKDESHRAAPAQERCGLVAGIVLAFFMICLVYLIGTQKEAGEDLMTTLISIGGCIATFFLVGMISNDQIDPA